MKKQTTTCVLCAVLSVSAFAQQGSFVNLGTFGDTTTYLATGANASRVGGGVLTYVHQLSGGFSTSVQVLAMCDGSQLSDTVRVAYVKEGNSIAELEQRAKAQASTYPLYRTALSDWKQSEFDFAPALKFHIKNLCKSASLEPKNVAVPIGNYEEKQGEPGGVVAFLTGTAVRRDQSVEIWLRTNYYTQETLLVNGEPVLSNGVARKHRVETGAYELRRTAFNCVTRQLGSHQVIEYDKAGSVIDQTSIPREKVKLLDVVPETVGEAQLDTICTIYGGK
ncbi:hypothetical protein [Rhodoferax bucti]|uniref:hypothetical protein n=1 Tax=Rhodoferax bucti TaxID=2576305 RepID=UPI00110926A6|nr:hypothetical protein [Rhodoferax bucti]